MGLDAQLAKTCITSGLVGFVASAVAAPIVYRLLLRTGSRQSVSEHVPEHQDKQGTPTMGGLIIIVGVLATMIATQDPRNIFTGCLFAWFALIGFLDDFVVPRMAKGKRGLGWMPKLALQVVPFLVLWALAPTLPIWIVAITTFVVLFAANAYNFADGLDGLAGGLGIIFALGLVVLTIVAMPETRDASHLPLLVGLAFAILPFLFLNAPPAKVFMGDVGSLPIGALLGMGFLQSTLFLDPAEPNWNRMWLALPILFVLAAELIPVPLQIASAKLRKGKRLFPFRTPIHHGFQSAGWPETRVTVVFVLVQFLAVAVAVGLVAWQTLGVDNR